MKNKLKIIIPVGIALIAIALAFVFIRFTPSETVDISGVIDTAQQYLIDQKYEQAIAEFEKAIQIDPMNADAYIGIAQAYEAIGDTEKAIEWLQKGYDLTGDTSLKDEIDRLYVRSAEGETTATTTVEATTIDTTPAPIEYSNEELEEVLLKLIEDPNADIEQSKLDAITCISILGADYYAVNQSVYEKYGIDYWNNSDYSIGFRDGTEIYFEPGNIENIIFLKKLKNLERIDIMCYNINDISEISNMTNLEHLELTGCQISDISALSNLTNLKELYLDNNQISDISALSNLTNLEGLCLGDNQISDISALSNLNNLECLYLYDNQVTDISALSNLTNLKEIYLDNNQISDISALSNLTNLKEIYLDNNQISDISALSNLTNLKELYLDNNQISDISALSNLTNLEGLYLINNQISDISALNNLTNLTGLDLRGNPISESDIEELEKALPNCGILG